MYCSNCGQKLEAVFSFCPECGTKVDADNTNLSDEPIETKICPSCNAAMPNDMFYCLNCGYQFPSTSMEEDYFTNNQKALGTNPYGSWKNKWVSFFLCLFFGFLGIHRFYEGKVFSGILYIFTFGLFGLGWFVDLIRIICKPNPYRVK